MYPASAISGICAVLISMFKDFRSLCVIFFLCKYCIASAICSMMSSATGSATGSSKLCSLWYDVDVLRAKTSFMARKRSPCMSSIRIEHSRPPVQTPNIWTMLGWQSPAKMFASTRKLLESTLLNIFCATFWSSHSTWTTSPKAPFPRYLPCRRFFRFIMGSKSTVVCSMFAGSVVANSNRYATISWLFRGPVSSCISVNLLLKLSRSCEAGCCSILRISSVLRVHSASPNPSILSGSSWRSLVRAFENTMPTTAAHQSSLKKILTKASKLFANMIAALSHSWVLQPCMIASACFTIR